MSKLRCWRRPVSNSIFRRLEYAQYSGQGLCRLSQIPDEVIDDVEKHYTGVAAIVKELDNSSVTLDFDPRQCFDALKTVLGHLMNFEPRRNNEECASEAEQNRYAQAFYNCGGLEVLLRLLMFGSLFPQDSLFSRESEVRLRIKSLVLEILTKITTTTVGDKVTRELLRHDDVLNYVFTLLAHQKTFINSCQLIEDMLQSRREVLDLHRIHNLRNLILCLDDQPLANFCRILAVTISDLDIYENKSSLFAQNKQKRTRGFVNVRDINQEMLLSIPELLPRLIRLAVDKDYVPRYRGMVSELECWMEWIENRMAEEIYENPVTDDFDDFIGGVSEPTTPGGLMTQQQGLKIMEELVQRVEVVYVLGLFLVGKHRKKVQRKLAELKLAPGLSDLFDQFIWKCQVQRFNSRHRLRGHNAACECSPEVALKIQFLRLVHSFCDHSDYKHLLLSKNELNELKRISAKSNMELPNIDNVNNFISRQLMCRGSKGLLTKIVEVMKKEPTASTFRFWLARAVESYLRGSTSYCDQIFLMRRGLLQHVAGNIVDHEIRHKEILQSSFDLLGEMIKFNIDAFKQFDTILHTKERFDKFIGTVNRNLVDSNMFIRSLILSYEHFLKEEPKHTEYCKKESRLMTYICDFKRQLDYLYKLINTINVQNLTQENVSCLNTTLVFLMFANQKNQLPSYLQQLRDEKEDMLDVNGSVSVMRNFRDLLTFWQDHYLHKDKDCSALEKSSRISFEYWKQTVTTLVSEDRSEKSAIVHYIQPLSDRPN